MTRNILTNEGMKGVTLDKYCNFFRNIRRYELKAWTSNGIVHAFCRVNLTPIDTMATLSSAKAFAELKDVDAKIVYEGTLKLAENAYLLGEVPDPAISDLFGSLVSTPIKNMHTLPVNRRRALWFSKEHVLQIRAANAQRKKDAADAVAEAAASKQAKKAKYLSTLQILHIEGFPSVDTRCSNAACGKKPLAATGSVDDHWTQCPTCSIWFCPKTTCGNHGKTGSYIKGHRKYCGDDDEWPGGSVHKF